MNLINRGWWLVAGAGYVAATALRQLSNKNEATGQPIHRCLGLFKVCVDGSMRIQWPWVLHDYYLGISQIYIKPCKTIRDTKNIYQKHPNTMTYTSRWMITPLCKTIYELIWDPQICQCSFWSPQILTESLWMFELSLSRCQWSIRKISHVT